MSTDEYCACYNNYNDDWLYALPLSGCGLLSTVLLSTSPLVFGWSPTSVSLTNVHVERRSTPKGYTDCRAKADLAGLCAIMLLTI